jgi:nucleotide-binding universal stress UspA family protein
MFEKILLATDFSAYATKTLECIAGFPGAREVILFHAAEEAISPRGGGEIGDTLFRPEYEHLREQKRYLEGLDPEIRVTTTITAASDTAGAIISAAEERGACLIVMGARGSNLMDGILLGSVSMAVIRRSGTSVLIMRHKTVGDLKEQNFELFCPRILCRALCPVDFSPSSDHALALAGATPAIGELLLLHVVPPGEAGSATGDAVQQAKGQLATIRDDLTRKNIRARVFVRTGNPVTEIIRIADEEDASVIWMSSRGAGWLRELLIGSTAFAVAMNAQRPVMVIRQPKCGGEDPPFSPS